MNNELIAPARRTKHTTARLVDRVLKLYDGGLPINETLECLKALAVQPERQREILTHYRRRT
jgi:hypothetical protein